VYNYFIRILISFDELCYMKDCVIKKVIEKRVTGCRDTILRSKVVMEIRVVRQVSTVL
jgi:hypothetical protein